MPEVTRILIVDDDPIVAESLADFLREQGQVVVTANSSREAMGLLDQPGESGAVGIVVLDLDMPGSDGMATLRDLRDKHPAVVPIAITDFGKIESAVEAIKLGAADYLTKPIVDDELHLAVNRAQTQHVLVAENQTLRSTLSERFGMANLVGADYRMQKVYDLIEAVAPTKTTVLITGKSGTGKTMVAKAVHAMSPRSGGPFVNFSCGSIPETLLESELFGHVKGAFTGADTDKPGKCLAADGGTLFIDEINSATPALQLRLLRVLQEKAFEPIGSTQTKQVDVRFILATNQPLEELVEAGSFREDLYYRINVVNLHMPTLHERSGDIPLLAEHFLERHCQEMGKERKLSESAMDALRAYAWPGNVRELENAIERAVVLSRATLIEPTDLPEAVGQGGGGLRSVSSNGHATRESGHIQVPALASGWTPTPLAEAMEAPERQILLAALEANEWNRQETAKQLDINRTTLYKKIRHYRLDEPGFDC
ncbi:sigma-54-dependent transcriptional regulator [Phycisphaerales bacterium AB-hyl4]|uniref:Sigma-54-dependent transcriptional regulator n=1 Tax=Natronomicrosphaera hydrolytica TaxID=3242702 RepID=A0ABV4U9B6_9BACT